VIELRGGGQLAISTWRLVPHGVPQDLLWVLRWLLSLVVNWGGHEKHSVKFAGKTKAVSLGLIQLEAERTSGHLAAPRCLWGVDQ